MLLDKYNRFMLEIKEKERLLKIRNIGIMAHIDAGKTTVTERMLFYGNIISKIGEVHDGEAHMDFLELEKERKITIQSATTAINWKNYQINIIDTPGHIDFTAEVQRSLRVLDCGIVVLDCKKGVQVQTETVWRQANKYKIPRLFFINKVDSIDNIEKFYECLESIKNKFKVKILVIQFPIGVGRDLKGIIDIVEKKAYYFQLTDKEGRSKESEIPFDLKEIVDKYYHELIEEVIEHDEMLLSKYLKEKDLSKEEIKLLIRKATLLNECFPVFCGSAYKSIGVNLLLDGVINFLPSPLDMRELTIFLDNNEEKKINLNFEKKSSCLALAFKITTDKHKNKLTFFRVYEGKITTNSGVYNVNSKKKERISNLVKVYANKKEKISEVKAGDIAAAYGLKETITGDTFSEEKKPIFLENIKFSDPVISQAIEVVKNKDEEKLKSAFKDLNIQDPSFNFSVNNETRQLIISGMGELHLEVIVDRLRREYNIDIKTKQQKVSYRETITKKKKIISEYKKQTGGAGHYAKVEIIFEPNEKENGFKFYNLIRGESVSNDFALEVKKGLEESLEKGLLLNCKTINVKASLIEGKTHSVD